jgi:hypothetical protein
LPHECAIHCFLFQAVRMTAFALRPFALDSPVIRLAFRNYPHRAHRSGGCRIPKIIFKRCFCSRLLRVQSHRASGFRIFPLCSIPSWHQSLPRRSLNVGAIR